NVARPLGEPCVDLRRRCARVASGAWFRWATVLRCGLAAPAALDVGTQMNRAQARCEPSREPGLSRSGKTGGENQHGPRGREQLARAAHVRFDACEELAPLRAVFGTARTQGAHLRTHERAVRAVRRKE